MRQNFITLLFILLTIGCINQVCGIRLVPSNSQLNEPMIDSSNIDKIFQLNSGVSKSTQVQSEQPSKIILEGSIVSSQDDDKVTTTIPKTIDQLVDPVPIQRVDDDTLEASIQTVDTQLPQEDISSNRINEVSSIEDIGNVSQDQSPPFLPSWFTSSFDRFFSQDELNASPCTSITEIDGDTTTTTTTTQLPGGFLVVKRSTIGGDEVSMPPPSPPTSFLSSSRPFDLFRRFFGSHQNPFRRFFKHHQVEDDFNLPLPVFRRGTFDQLHNDENVIELKQQEHIRLNSEMADQEEEDENKEEDPEDANVEDDDRDDHHERRHHHRHHHRRRHHNRHHRDRKHHRRHDEKNLDDDDQSELIRRDSFFDGLRHSFSNKKFLTPKIVPLPPSDELEENIKSFQPLLHESLIEHVNTNQDNTNNNDGNDDDDNGNNDDDNNNPSWPPNDEDHHHHSHHRGRSISHFFRTHPWLYVLCGISGVLLLLGLLLCYRRYRQKRRQQISSLPIVNTEGYYVLQSAPPQPSFHAAASAPLIQPQTVIEVPAYRVN